MSSSRCEPETYVQWRTSNLEEEAWSHLSMWAEIPTLRSLPNRLLSVSDSFGRFAALLLAALAVAAWAGYLKVEDEDRARRETAAALKGGLCEHVQGRTEALLLVVFDLRIWLLLLLLLAIEEDEVAKARAALLPALLRAASIPNRLFVKTAKSPDAREASSKSQSRHSRSKIQRHFHSLISDALLSRWTAVMKQAPCWLPPSVTVHTAQYCTVSQGIQMISIRRADSGCGRMFWNAHLPSETSMSKNIQFVWFPTVLRTSRLAAAIINASLYRKPCLFDPTDNMGPLCLHTANTHARK